ncbi:hypothetical protein [Streptomyces griseiscabiei]|uniref:GNAT family N-acetyltransferase n=1 Tax=Streptomyces griseiscabiei TaxID=2993540 RepID=A0ABU4L6V5_9ACTN|nr:hypothetical protein [Streptomyces griseiscabiei]MBZ3906489.1 hypothetical protein [Streptomyces griseiscabiei]MDX2911487.1 hypothetical protein [Streptomyces griseiscabiei]
MERLELSPIDADAVRPFWEGMQIRETTGQLATAIAALHGSPILMRLVARRVTTRRDGDVGAWLVKEKARITQTDDVDVLSQLGL